MLFEDVLLVSRMCVISFEINEIETKLLFG